PRHPGPPQVSPVRSLRTAAVAAAALSSLLAFAPCRAADAPPRDEGWQCVGKTGSVELFTRVRPGSPVKELKAVGSIDAAPALVERVIADVDRYTQFMPYIVECRVIARDAASVTVYQRISPPFCAGRDYTIRIRRDTAQSPAGAVFEDR